MSKHKSIAAPQEGSEQSPTSGIFPRERLLPNINRIFTLDGPDQYGDILDFNDPTKHIEVGAIPDQRLGGWRDKLPNGTRIEIRFPYMGVHELRMLNTLMLIASSCTPIKRGSIEKLRTSIMSAESDSLLQRMSISVESGEVKAIGKDVMTLQFSERALMRSLGLSSNDNDSRQRMLLAITLLSMTRIRVMIPPSPEEMKKNRLAASHVLGMSIISDYENVRGRVNLTVSPFIMRAIDRAPGTYTLYSLQESLSVRGDAAFLLHSWLSSFISAGETRVLLIESLAERLWFNYTRPELAKKDAGQQEKPRKGGRPPAADGLNSDQRRVIRNAMLAIRNMGWTVSEAGGKFTVTRPARHPALTRVAPPLDVA